MKRIALGLVMVALPTAVYAEKTAISCVTTASAPVSLSDVPSVEKGRKVILEATTTDKGKRTGYIRDEDTGDVIGWVDRKVLACR